MTKSISCDRSSSSRSANSRSRSFLPSRSSTKSLAARSGSAAIVAAFDLIPLPHPSGASPWHRIPPGLGLLAQSDAIDRTASGHAESAAPTSAFGGHRPPLTGSSIRRWTLERWTLDVLPSVPNDHPKILTRADLPDSDKWDLTHLFTDVDKWTEDFAWIQQTYPETHRMEGPSRRIGRRRSPLVWNSRNRSIKKSSAFTTTPRSSSPKTAPTRSTSRAWGSCKICSRKISETASFLGPGNPGDPGRQVRAVSGGSGAGRRGKPR